MRRIVVALMMVLAPAQPALAGDPNRAEDLARIRQTMSEELAQLPNYTCLETIERFGGDGKRKLRTLDTLRLSVAVVKGRELYAGPGGEFEDKGITRLVTTGFISDGNFSSMPRKVFAAGTLIWFTGIEKLQGRDALRYEFQIPADQAGWSVSAGAAFARVGARGSFWADATTLEVLKLEFGADGLPAWLQNKLLEQNVEYARIPIGGREVLLPKATEMRTESFSGEKHENRARFSDCHQYGSETTIRFDSEEDMLPAGLSLRLRLETAIDSATAAAGQPLKANLLQAVSFAGGALPEGAGVTGAVLGVHRNPGSDPHADISLEWSRLEAGGKSWNLQGRLIDLDTFPDLRRSLLESLYRSDDSGSLVTVNGLLGRIPAGVQMTWRTAGKR